MPCIILLFANILLLNNILILSANIISLKVLEIPNVVFSTFERILGLAVLHILPLSHGSKADVKTSI